MSSLIPRRPAPAPAPVQVLDPDAALNRQIVRAQTPGVLAAASIQSAAFATNVALQQAAMLSLAANRAFKMSPMGEDVYQAIFMAYGSVAVTEIQRLGLHPGGSF